MSKKTVNLAEVKKFSQLANEWWDETGSFKPLHKFNPVRINYLRREIVNTFGLENNPQHLPLKGLKILDIGCGGGLLCEPLAKLGAEVTGIDASEENIEVAKIHAKQSDLIINYKNQDIEEIAKEKVKFDVVLTMEVVEHVDNVEIFLENANNLVKKNGLIFTATLNRTYKSYLFAIIGAEYILRWLKVGTHDWKKFLKPSEIFSIMEKCKMKHIKSDGFEYNPFLDSWKETKNLDVNYIMSFKK